MYDYSEDFSVPNDNDVNDDLYREDDQPRSDGDPPAIKFELSITFQGRKYNATRAFPTFVKLRNDLLREYIMAMEGIVIEAGVVFRKPKDQIISIKKAILNACRRFETRISTEVR